MYEMDTELKILISQYSDKTAEKQGKPMVHNEYAMVEIDGIEISGNIQFELMIDGEWVSGHRANSQFGQIFINSRRTVIITDNLQGRVWLPLHLDGAMNVNCSVDEPLASAGMCVPVGTCALAGTYASSATSTLAGNCTPAGTCAPAGSCAPAGTCAPTVTCCSPSEWTVC